MPTAKYPHTMKKGVFKGRTFKSLSEYQAAVKAHSTKYGPTRKTQKSPTVSSNGELYVRRIVEGYELLMGQGVGRNAAIKILNQLVEGGKH